MEPGKSNCQLAVSGIDTKDNREHRQKELPWGESEARYRAIVEAFDGLIYICSPDYRIEFMNPRLIARTGYDGTGEYCYKVLHERDSICPWCVNERVFRGETVRWEVQSPKDNRWYLVVNVPIFHRDGRVSKQAMIQDITELKQTEEALRQAHHELERRVGERTAHLKQANEQLIREIEERQQIEDRLRESEARFLAFMQHLPGGAVIRDLEGRYLFANKAWEKAFSQDNWLGKTLEEIWPEDTAKHMRELDHKAIITGEPVEAEISLQQKDGPHTWLINWFPILGEDGQVAMVGSAGVDVTERLEAEEALKQSETSYRKLVVAAPFGISIIDKDGHYKYLNPKFEELFGYTLADIPTGRDWFTKAYPDPGYRNMVLADWQAEFQRLRIGEVRPRTFRVTCKDGATKIINFRAVAMATGDWLIFYEDITQRVQAEEALAESEEKYRLLVNQIPAVVFKGYADGRVEFFDDKIAGLTGFNKEEFDTGRLKWTDLILPEDVPGAREALRKALRGNGKYVREYRIRKQDGGVLWIQGRGKIFCQADGGIDHISGVLFDITERKLGEEALRQSELKYRTLVEQIPAMVYQGYPDWSIDCFDRKIEDLTGYDKKDFDSRRLKWSDLIPAEEMDYVRRTFIEALKTDKSYVREHRIRKKNGEYAWVHCRGQVFCDAGGKLEYVRGVVFDITKQKQSEEALKVSEARYRLLAENVSDVIWTVDLNLKFTYVSPSSRLLIGFDPQEVIQGGLEAILTPASLEQARCIFAAEMLSEIQQPDLNRSRIMEMELVRKDGSTVWTEIKASFLRDEQERPVGILGITRDISKRKAAELALRRREAILEAVSFAAEKFLQTESWDKDIQDILVALGRSANASRVHIFEKQLDAAGEMLIRHRYEWVAAGIAPTLDNPALQHLPWQKVDWGRWKEQLSRGQLIVGHAREFPRSEREVWAIRNIKSIIAVPISVGSQFWGVICFEECRQERQWSLVELEAIKAAANILGAAIQHEKAEQALKNSAEKLRCLTAQLITAQETERKRLAAELHDELGHALLSLKLSIRSLEKQLTPEQQSLRKSIDKILLNIGDTINDVRRLYLDLSPGDLEVLGLTTALQNMMEEFMALYPEVKWKVGMDNLDGLFPVPAATAIYRIVQEALTNIGKHARAKKVSLSGKKEGRGIAITIQDNGRGFDTGADMNNKKSLGLLAMEERVKILGGSFALWSNKNRGTSISFNVPLPETEARSE
jgi:PAS domain S-box-containing protein